MTLKEKNLLEFEDNDIYQLETYGNKIIVNEDYFGIRVLDLSLNTIKIIPIFDGLIVSDIYKKPGGNAILIYDSHQGKLIFIDLETYSPVVINIRNFINHYIWPEAYYWHQDKIIFAISKTEFFNPLKEHHNIFYQLDLASFTLTKISSKKVRSIAPNFFIFYTICKRHDTFTIDSYKQTFTFKKNSKIIGFYDHKIGKNLHRYRVGMFEDIYYHRNNFITFHNWEKNIGFAHHKFFIKAEDPSYYCLRISFLDNNNVAILQTNRDNHKFCNIGIYEL